MTWKVANLAHETSMIRAQLRPTVQNFISCKWVSESQSTPCASYVELLQDSGGKAVTHICQSILKSSEAMGCKSDFKDLLLYCVFVRTSACPVGGEAGPKMQTWMSPNLHKNWRNICTRNESGAEFWDTHIHRFLAHTCKIRHHGSNCEEISIFLFFYFEIKLPKLPEITQRAPLVHIVKTFTESLRHLMSDHAHGFWFSAACTVCTCIFTVICCTGTMLAKWANRQHHKGHKFTGNWSALLRYCNEYSWRTKHVLGCAGCADTQSLTCGDWTAHLHIKVLWQTLPLINSAAQLK